MSLFDSEFSNEEEFELPQENIEEELAACKKILDTGYVYDSVERIEEVAQTCIDIDRFEDALYLIEKLLEIFPYNSEYWLKKGIILNGLFRFGEALLSYEQSLSLNPNDVETLIDKSATEENLGLFDQARESLEKVLQL
ncbi:MAG TPA: hypothetical protein VF270_12855, partial [Ignavibacteriaceae bacterium]